MVTTVVAWYNYHGTYVNMNEMDFDKLNRHNFLKLITINMQCKSISQIH